MKRPPIDKQAHFWLGMAACAVAQTFVQEVYFPFWETSLMFGLVGATALGVFIELSQDWFNSGTPDVWDAIATILGGMTFAAAVILIRALA